ncbi:MAG: GNAT family N-acetyltransferase [Methanolobus sp.]
MFELGKTEEGVAFYKLEHDFELDKLKIGEFSYFRKYLGMSDYLANFRSWLKRPTVALVLAISGNTVVGWAMNEKWSSASSDGRPVYVLRGIEISPQLARKGMGRKMFYLISRVLVGHIITKPVNKTAKLFFESMDFAEPDSISPVNLMDHPGYLIFEEEKKDTLTIDGIHLLDENINSYGRENVSKRACIRTTRSALAAKQRRPKVSESAGC